MITHKLRILPLGGLGEIGMNCMLLECDDHSILIDCGIQFADPSYTGIELLAPDFSFLRKKIKNVNAIVLTHGHEDHIGAIPHLSREMPLKVYCTPFPRGLLADKLSEVQGAKPVDFVEIKPRQKFKIGPFEIDPIPVAHSIIESLALAIKTPYGTVIHTGDFKHDAEELGGQKFDFQPFEEYGKEGVMLLLSDSTNAERTGHTLSEKDIANSFDRIFSEQKGRLIIGLFASNIRRVENMLKVAQGKNKKVALIGRSMHSYTRLAKDQRSLSIPADTLIDIEDTHKYPDEQVVILATGSQAEPGSAMMRISLHEHPHVKIKAGDYVILSSRFIPGNERSITRMIDELYRLGADVLYESIHQIHVSGHGFQEELLMMLRAVKPKFFTPVHGEYRHLKKHALLAQQSGVIPENINVIENGQSLTLQDGRVILSEKVGLKKTAIIDGYIIEAAETEYAQRVSLSKSGVVFVVLLVDFHTLELAAPPKVHYHGLLFKQGVDPRDVIEDAIDFVSEIFAKTRSLEDLEKNLQLELRRFFKRAASHKPVVMPMIFEI